MSDRFLAPFGALALLVAVVSAAPVKWTPPRQPDGRPDLQGVWLIRTATPLERPKALEGRPFLTPEEVVQLRERADRLFKSGNSDFAAGDNVFLAALANLEHYRNPNATHGAVEMVDREFDNRTSLIVDPPDGRIPPLTAAAQQRQDIVRTAGPRPAAGPEDLASPLRCLSWSVPRLGGRYGAGDLAYYQILQTPGYIVFFMETGDEARIVPLDGRPHLPDRIRQWKGDSRGRWDGDTLVVDTTNFSPKSNFMGSSSGLHLVERFTRVADDTIDYQMTIADDTVWTRAWTALVPLKRTSARLYEFGCHEGNAEIMRGMLSAARVDERTAAPTADQR